jgi:hypothetical protein
MLQRVWRRIAAAASGMARVFIPAKIRDNRKLLEKDPEYVKRLWMLPAYLFNTDSDVFI